MYQENLFQSTNKKPHFALFVVLLKAIEDFFFRVSIASSQHEGEGGGEGLGELKTVMVCHVFR